MTDRVVVLVDMDCFYCQVEQKLNPSLLGKPLAVVQYNEWRGGGIIAVNYEARAKGVTRAMRGDEAKKLCPDIELVKTRTVGDKADLTDYREASSEVFSVLSTYSDCVLRASIDEAYLDLTEVVKKKRLTEPTVPLSKLPNTFIVGYTPDQTNDEEERRKGTGEWLSDVYSSGLEDDAPVNLAVAAVIVEQMRLDVYNKTGFRCSAGIAHNKTLSKVVCGLHKPNRQTVVPHSSICSLYSYLPPNKIRSLGGKLGQRVTHELGCRVMADLRNFSLNHLQQMFDDRQGRWLYDIARGLDYEPVTSRLISKSIGCCKQFPGKTALACLADVEHWLKNLSTGLAQRVLADQLQNKRSPQLLTVSVTLNKRQTSSKSMALHLFDAEKIFTAALPAVKRMCSDQSEQNWIPIFCLGVSASKFTEKTFSKPISAFLKPHTVKPATEEGESAKVESNLSGFFTKFISESEALDRKDGEAEVDPWQESSCDDVIPEETAVDAEAKTSPYFRVEAKADNVKLKDGKVKDFFKRIPTKEGRETTNKCKTGQLVEFFKKTTRREVPDLLEVFPDPESVDPELLDSLPTSFRRKLMEMRQCKEGEVRVGGERGDACRVEGGSIGGVSLGEGEQSSGGVDEEGRAPGDVACSVESGREAADDSSGGEIVASLPQPTTEGPGRDDHLVTCHQCGHQVHHSHLTEHLDVHMAHRLHAGGSSGGEIVASLPQLTTEGPGRDDHLVTCHQCGHQVLHSHLTEHLDGHMAQRLHAQLNPSSSGPHLPTVSTKRKPSPQKPSKIKKIKTLTKYFSR